MRRTSILQPLAAAVMLTVATGCDNVDWGGVDLALRPPLTAEELAALDSARAAHVEPAEEVVTSLPEGPILLAGIREGRRAELRWVGRIRNDALEALPGPSEDPELYTRLVDERLRPVRRWILFSGGVRVGSFFPDSVATDHSFCGAPAVLSGWVELAPSAEPTRLLALPEEVAASRPYGVWRAYRHDYDQRVASLRLASQAIRRLGAPWPPDGVLAARKDIQAFRLPGADAASIAATFTFQDDVRVGPPAGPRAYALFLMGSPGASGYVADYLWHRPASEDGKGVPRFFDHLDLDGDGSDEVLLDVFGEEAQWYALLSRRASGWTRTYEHPCGRRPAAQ